MLLYFSTESRAQMLDCACRGWATTTRVVRPLKGGALVGLHESRAWRARESHRSGVVSVQEQMCNGYQAL